MAWEEGVTRPLLLVPKEVGKWRDEKGCGLREGESHTAIISSSNSSRQVRGRDGCLSVIPAKICKGGVGGCGLGIEGSKGSRTNNS